MVFSTEHQLDLPDGFPADELVAFMASARKVLLTSRMSEVWPEFGGASNLIGWRFRACHEEMVRYIWLGQSLRNLLIAGRTLADVEK